MKKVVLLLAAVFALTSCLGITAFAKGKDEVMYSKLANDFKKVLESDEYKEKLKKIEFSSHTKEKKQEFKVGEFTFIFTETDLGTEEVKNQNSSIAATAAETTYVTTKEFTQDAYALVGKVASIKSTYTWYWSASKVTVKTPPSVSTSIEPIAGLTAYWKDTVATPSYEVSSESYLKMEGSAYLQMKIFIGGVGDLWGDRAGTIVTAWAGVSGSSNEPTYTVKFYDI